MLPFFMIADVSSYADDSKLSFYKVVMQMSKAVDESPKIYAKGPTLQSYYGLDCA